MSGESLTIVALSAEVTRLRAALSEIAALQTEEPEYPLDDETSADDLCGGNFDDAFAAGQEYGEKAGRFEAAEMARKGLGS